MERVVMAAQPAFPSEWGDSPHRTPTADDYLLADFDRRSAQCTHRSPAACRVTAVLVVAGLWLVGTLLTGLLWWFATGDLVHWFATGVGAAIGLGLSRLLSHLAVPRDREGP